MRNIYFISSISIERSWMTRLKGLEVYNSIFKITEENNKFEFHTDNFNEFSFTESKDELEETLSFSDITPQHLQHEIIGPRFIQVYKKFRIDESNIDG